MKITEIYVERLKSYPDYSNRTVGLKAVLDEGENVEEAYRKLAEQCETLLEIQEIRANKKLIDLELMRYEERKKELEKARQEFQEIREHLENELRELQEELMKIERLAEEKQLKLSEKIIEKIRSIRRALGFYDPDP